MGDIDDSEARVENVPDENLIDESSLHQEYESVPPNIFQYAWHYIATANPFVLIIIGVGFYFLYQRKIKPYLAPKWEEFKRRREEEAEIAAIKKNPDLYRERMEAVERARQRMQEQYDMAAQELKEKEAAKEEAKRQEKIQEWENFKDGKGYRNKSDKYKNNNEPTTESGQTLGGKKKSTLRPDYNPLMGNSSGPSCTYRPGRRGASGGG